MRLHPFHTSLPRPLLLADPFSVEPDALCRSAAGLVWDYAQGQKEWQDELQRGKMLGVMVVEDCLGRLFFLAAYSGLLGGRNDWDYFVPPIFDAQQPDGYFKAEEENISRINQLITEKETEPQRLQLKESLIQLRQEAACAVNEYKAQMYEAKKRRDERRKLPISSAERDEIIKESQFQKAELRRLQQRYRREAETLENRLSALDTFIEQLKHERAVRSDALQRWLFEQYTLVNGKGEKAHLVSVFDHFIGKLPPAGAGDCCAPKLFQYAFLYHLRPLGMAEFWVGDSPKGEVRRHLHFYPPCRGKCLPILTYMLQGVEVATATSDMDSQPMPEVVYEDESIVVVRKPSGLPSVAGKIPTLNLHQWLRHRYPSATGPLIVHRLDMATSGLMVAAKTKLAHQILQAQFARHAIHKTYIAVVEGIVHTPRGTVSLPLRPDWFDRPRQIVDEMDGKEAVTQYEVIGTEGGFTRLRLYPLTGRTHQLRVHCAHPKGLNAPIKGDTLYGKPSKRLCLHACQLAFAHPVSGQPMSFTWEAEF